MSKYIFEEKLSTEDINILIDQQYAQRKINNAHFDKEKVHEEFSNLCRKSSKENIEYFAKVFPLDMDYQEGFFPIVAANHDNLEALRYFYDNHQDIYNKYYNNLVNAAAFNRSINCQDFLTSHHDVVDQNIQMSGVHEQHIDVL